MGNGGTRDRALGLASVTLLARAIAASLSVLALAGCTLTGNLVAAAAGGATGAATANPAVGIAVGVAVNSAIDATFAYAGRKLQQSEQDALASEVGTMQVGERRPWRIDHFIPIGQLEMQRRLLTSTRSTTLRVFTTAEQAQAHCQVGNLPLAINVMTDWVRSR